MNLAILDIATGWLSILNATIVCAVLSLTSPGKGHWISLPLVPRILCLPFIVLVGLRGVELISLAGNPDELRGHASLATLMGGLSLLLMLGGFLGFVLSQTYPVRIWSRINQILALARCGPRSEPVVMTTEDAARLVAATAAPGSFITGPRINGSVPGGFDEHSAHHHPDAIVRH